ncbi:hypothetical protein C8J56DRAFT_880096 [Mycena floridula]|nr:hypothetical protein C8J56DRAFT_880096 [Mycena floridula]
MTMESSDAIQPFPELPFELKCLILKEMVEMVPQRAVEFVSLSRDIRPMNPSAISLFINMLKARWRPDAFYKSWVKVLCIPHPLDSDNLRVILSECSGVQKLALPLLGLDDDGLASSGLHPIELSLNSFPTRRSDGSDRFNLPLFQHVTHLELHLWYESDFDVTRLQALPNLTHLSLLYYDNQPQLLAPPQTLDLPDSIMVCILFRYKTPVRDILCQDPRVVIGSYESSQASKRIGTVLWRNLMDFDYFVSQWGRHSDREFVDMWEEAEEIVQIQRRNKSSTARCIDTGEGVRKKEDVLYSAAKKKPEGRKKGSHWSDSQKDYPRRFSAHFVRSLSASIMNSSNTSFSRDKPSDRYESENPDKSKTRVGRNEGTWKDIRHGSHSANAGVKGLSEHMNGSMKSTEWYKLDHVFMMSISITSR